MSIFMKASPYLLYPLAVLVVIKLTYAYSKNPASPEKEKRWLSWLILSAFLVLAGLGLYCSLGLFDWFRHTHWLSDLYTDGEWFVTAAISTVAGLVCAGLTGRHLRLGRTYRSIAGFTGIGLGTLGFMYMAHRAVLYKLLVW